MNQPVATNPDVALAQLAASVKQIVAQATQQMQENQRLSQSIITELTRPRRRRPIRGASGRIEGSEEMP